MKVNRVYSPDIYRKIMLAEQDKKDDIYRYDMMMPFKGKWDIYHIPMTPKYPGGYDIIMANRMFGLASPSDIDGSYEEQINSLANDDMWAACQDSIEKALIRFYDNGIDLKIEEYTYSILLADPKSPYTIMNDGYCGDGGIPGFIMGWLIPTEKNIKRLPVALAHETNHNVRYQFIKWTNDVNVAEMIVSEGLAENYATTIFGEEHLGPWVTKTDMELMPLIKEIIHDGLEVTGFDNITSYLYGDEMAEMRQFPKVGLPYCAGYATGYYLIKYYLEKTGMPIEKATTLPAEEILKAIPEFWEI